MFEVGKEYQRRTIHAQYGGQMQGGMSTPLSHPIILLFTGNQGERYGYEDKFQPDGVFWYTGEGQVGDMLFVRANKSLAEHGRTGKRVFLFEEARRGFARFIGEVEYVGHHQEDRTDRLGNMRRALVFHLAFLPPAPESAIEESVAPNTVLAKPIRIASLAELRKLAVLRAPETAGYAERLAIVRVRTEAVRRYALKRAAGICEGCRLAAPFSSQSGPYLEVHHVFRLTDGGPDHPAGVVALCPNCHREVHYGKNGSVLNNNLIAYLKEKEGLPRGGQAVVHHGRR